MARKLTAAVASLDRTLRSRTTGAAAELCQVLDERRVRCHACGHRCVILPGLDGICRVRFNDAGTLRVPHGYVGGLQVDPIEKKPFYHVLPGAAALSFGMLGCDFHCGYCQNWLTSQALRDEAALAGVRDIAAGDLVSLAGRNAAPVIVSTYNEPLITSEWAVEVFRAARAAGLLCGYVSNGNATEQVLEYLRPQVDLYKIDLKSFRDRAYRALGGKLRNVLDSIERVHAMGFWTEIVTLVVPGFNDSDDELREIAAFLAGVSRDIPWHVTAFHRDYKMTGPADTTPRQLVRAAELGREAGLRHVYVGNLPGLVGDWEHTRCAGCDTLLIERRGFHVTANRLDPDGACGRCGRRLPGVWRAAGPPAQPAPVR